MRLRDLVNKATRRSPRELGQELAKRFRARTQWERHLDGRAWAPYAVSFWLTRRCNLNCAMCWVAASKKAPGGASPGAPDELTLDELKAVVDDVRRWRPRIGVTGGEPFLRGDAVAFLSYVKNRGLRCGVNTNGTFLTRDAEALVALALDSVMVSVDGPAAVHDRIRGSAGAFARAREGIAALLAARPEAGAATPYVKVTCTISADNVDNLYEAAAAFRDFPLDEFTYQHLWFTDAATSSAQRGLFRKLFDQDTTYLGDFVAAKVPPLDVAVLSESRRRIEAERWPFPVNFYPALADAEVRPFYEEPARMLRRPCFSRWLRADVTPDGDVTPCLGFVAGNVRERPFPEIWNGAAFRAFRQELAARRAFPGCARCCGLYSD